MAIAIPIVVAMMRGICSNYRFPQYTVVRRLHFIVLVFLHSLLSLSLSVSLSLSCKSFVVSIRLEVAASSGHLKNTFILVPNTTIHSFHQQL